MEDDYRHALVLRKKRPRNPVQVRKMADDHDVVLQPGSFSPKRVDIVVGPDTGDLLPRGVKRLLKLLRGLRGSQRFGMPDLIHVDPESSCEIGAPAYLRQSGFGEGRSNARIAGVRIYIAVPHQVELHGLILSSQSSGYK